MGACSGTVARRSTGGSMRRRLAALASAVGVAAAVAVVAVGPLLAPPAQASGLKQKAASVLDTAHRGLVGPMVRKGQDYADPNTIPACLNAVRHDVDACEFDLRFTSDNQPVVTHNRSLDGWSDCTGEIAAKTLAEVTVCRTKHGIRVPSLDEFLAQVAAKSSTIRFLEDLKPTVITDAQLTRLVQIDVAHGIVADRLRFSSPSMDILQRLERRAPIANKALLVHRGAPLPGTSDLPSGVVDTVLVHVKSLGDELAKHPAYVSTMRSGGFGVAVWGAKSLARMQELVSLRVEEIITKRPDVFEEWRSS